MDFEIVMTERWTFLDELSNPVDGYRITFRLKDGTVDFVHIAEAMYNPEVVGAAIGEKVIRHKAMSELGTEVL